MFGLVHTVTRHFRVLKTLTFKTWWKWIYLHENNKSFSHLASLWNRGVGELGNGPLLRTKPRFETEAWGNSEKEYWSKIRFHCDSSSPFSFEFQAFRIIHLMWRNIFQIISALTITTHGILLPQFFFPIKQENWTTDLEVNQTLHLRSAYLWSCHLLCRTNIVKKSSSLKRGWWRKMKAAKLDRKRSTHRQDVEKVHVVTRCQVPFNWGRFFLKCNFWS